MIDSSQTTPTRPYLIRALYEWCTDNGLTPYVAVAVDDSVQVPREFVKDGEIVLNISFDATTALKLDNDYIEFKARFGGVAREIIVPVGRVTAIFAKENGQGMSFPLEANKSGKSVSRSVKSDTLLASLAGADPNESKTPLLVSVESSKSSDESVDGDHTPRTPTNGPRPTLTRVK
jgi:stringent starvation protein B